ncbi:1-deoxy-D-xylulose-5-phosphate reductoisomerase [Aliidiomarina soli]|uniref:1-deoxy-D-xylulose 5-phosphate reductoisomerase n=1 Tax=Aliidiomarina soli TaxID=1928574 RepID=A0A432WLR0_9GAMM|nr:1-deoxy-D-xylulose-5-phosphate reductoisomerase [Aliidiomarina soli]RUO34671.1 1-deoxy-D-xylulose-5-phosphate reductoisomerase [Aliidiomarina soli]
MSGQRLTILGATGSIGSSTLDVIAQHPQRFELFAVTAHSNVTAMEAICQRFTPSYAVMVDEQAANRLREALADKPEITVLAGAQALLEVSAASEVDQVMAAIVGAAGLAPTLAAVKAGKRVLLANKEALVMSGQLFMDAVQHYGAELLPVDSEHNAIFQCLTTHAQSTLGQVDLEAEGISKILLTGSGGPFLNLPVNQLNQQTPAAACKHPNWSMGQKISVDSATMLNKGLEYIEARWLFNCRREQLDIVIHPQSVIHSMVQYSDGSVLAQLGQPDMKTPIAHCMHYPHRRSSGVKALDFTQLGALTFVTVDEQRYPCLRLAQQACWQGQAATTALNASNEIAVENFLAERIQFGQISEVCDRVLQQLQMPALGSIDDVVAFDQKVRRVAFECVEALT